MIGRLVAGQCARSRTRKAWIFRSVGLLAMLWPAWEWYWNINPTVTVPALPAPPQPNGFDVLSRAGKAIEGRDLIDWAASEGAKLPESRRGKPYTAAEMAQNLARNQTSLAAARRSLTMPYQNVYRRSFEATYPELGGMREMARLFRLEGQVEEAKGLPEAAVQSGLDGIEMGADQVPRQGTIAHWLVGQFCEAAARPPLWTLAGKLKAADARAAARRMENIDARRVPLADALTEEKWASEVSIAEFFRDHMDLMRHEFGGDQETSKPSDVAAAKEIRTKVSLRDRMRDELADLRDGVVMIATTKKQVVRHYDTYMNALIQRSRLPYSVAAPEAALPGDAVNRIVCPNFDTVRLFDANVRALDRLLTTVFALQAYYGQHADYPKTLAALVSDGDLARVPVDPFDPASSPLRYKRVSAGRYVLYSVGPDGKDDGGRPITDEDAARRKTHYFKKSAIGDIVAGGNLR